MKYKKNLSVFLSSLIVFQTSAQNFVVAAQENDIREENNLVEGSLAQETEKEEVDKEIPKEEVEVNIPHEEDTEELPEVEEIPVQPEVPEQGMTSVEKNEVVEEINKQEEQSEKDVNPQAMSYLLDLSKFKDFVFTQNTNITAIRFSDEVLPANTAGVDLTTDGDGSILGHVDGTTAIITSNTAGQPVRFPSVCDKMFSGAGSAKLTSIEFNNVDTSSVEIMNYMFLNCSRLVTLDLRQFNTSNVVQTGRMFWQTNSLESVDLSSFDTSNVVTMEGMFMSSGVKEIKFGSNFKTSKVVYMNDMFSFCSNLTTLDLSGFDTSSVTDMSQMFYLCGKLESLDVSHFDTRNVTSMHAMFSNCSKLATIDVSGFNTSKVTSMASMFDNCINLKKVNVSGFDTSNVLNMTDMFSSCRSLSSIDVSNFKTGNVTKMQRMFNDCQQLTAVDVSRFDTSKVDSMYGLFSGCLELPAIDVSNFETQNVTSMAEMFKGCLKVTSLDVSGFDTSNVETMRNMFDGCSALQELNVSNFKTDKVFDMSAMFKGCKTLSTIDVSNFNTLKVENMGEMFSNCQAVTQLDVSNFDTSQVVGWDPGSTLTGLAGMFQGCSQLTSLDVSRFNTAQVKDMRYTFDGCSRLTELNLENFNTANTAAMDGMFRNCTGLTKIYSPAWDTSKVKSSSNMFANCTNVVGESSMGIFTPFNPAQITATMATPEGGYFTALQINWSGIVEYVTEDGQKVSDHTFAVPKLTPTITAKDIEDNIPRGYAAIDPISDITLNDNGQKITVTVKEVKWTITVNLMEGQTQVGSKTFEVPQLNPVVTVAQIQEMLPAGYESVDPLQDLTASADKEVLTVNVQKAKWTATVKVMFGQQELASKLFEVEELNPVITAAEMQALIPTGYEAITPVQDVTVNADGTEFTVDVREVKWTATVKVMDGQKEVASKAFEVAQLTPTILAAEIQALIPTGYEAINPVQDITVNADGAEFTIDVREVKWTAIVKIMDGQNQLVSKSFEVTQLNPVINTAEVQALIPAGYEPVTPLQNLTVTANNEELTVNVQKIKWAATVKVMFGQQEIVSKNFEVEELNPVISAADIQGIIPAGYETINPVQDITVNADGAEFTIDVREVKWTVTVNFMEGQTQVVSKTLEVSQLNPVVTEATIQGLLPAGYESVDPLQDLTVATNNEVLTVNVQKVKWTATVKVMFGQQELASKSFKVEELNPVISADELQALVPTGYEVVNPVQDVTVTTDGQEFTIDVREVKWTVTVNLMEGQTQVGSKTFEVPQLNPVVTVAQIQEMLPAGYESVDPLQDLTASADKEVLTVNVQKAKWTATVKVMFGQQELASKLFEVEELNPVITAAEMQALIPTGYEAINPVQDVTVNADGAEFTIDVREVKWTATVKVMDGQKEVASKAFEVAQLTPTIPAAEIQALIPTGYEAINPVQDITVNADGAEFTIDVREVKWAATVKIMEDQNQLVSKSFEVTQLNPVINAAEVQALIPAGYEPVTPLQNLTVTANNEELTVNVQKVKWNAILQYMDGATPVKEYPVEVTMLDPTISKAEIEAQMPKGYQAVNALSDLTVKADGDVLTVEVQQVKWNATVKIMFGQQELASKVFEVAETVPVISASEIQGLIPVGYESINGLQDITLKSNGEEFLIEVKETKWIATVKLMDGTTEVVSREFEVMQLNPIISASEIQGLLPTGYEFIDPVQDLTVTTNNQVLTVNTQKVKWNAVLKYMNGTNQVKEYPIAVAMLDPIISKAEIEAQMPVGYESASPLSDLTVKADGDVFTIEVKETKWTATVKLMDGSTEVASKTYEVTQLAPTIAASQLQLLIPQGYTPVSPLQDLVVTKDGEVFTIKVTSQKVEIPEKDKESVTPTPTNQKPSVKTAVSVLNEAVTGIGLGILGLTGAMLFKKKNKK